MGGNVGVSVLGYRRIEGKRGVCKDGVGGVRWMELERSG